MPCSTNPATALVRGSALRAASTTGACDQGQRGEAEAASDACAAAGGRGAAPAVERAGHLRQLVAEDTGIVTGRRLSARVDGLRAPGVDGLWAPGIDGLGAPGIDGLWAPGVGGHHRGDVDGRRARTPASTTGGGGTARGLTRTEHRAEVSPPNQVTPSCTGP